MSFYDVITLRHSLAEHPGVRGGGGISEHGVLFNGGPIMMHMSGTGNTCIQQIYVYSVHHIHSPSWNSSPLNTCFFFIIVVLFFCNHEIFDFRFFYESVSPKPLSIPLGPFRIFSKIRGDIRSSRCTTFVVNNARWQMKKSSIRKDYFFGTPLYCRINKWINFSLQVHF
jgi:hypothetical protein